MVRPAPAASVSPRRQIPAGTRVISQIVTVLSRSDLRVTRGAPGAIIGKGHALPLGPLAAPVIASAAFSDCSLTLFEVSGPSPQFAVSVTLQPTLWVSSERLSVMGRRDWAFQGVENEVQND